MRRTIALARLVGLGTGLAFALGAAACGGGPGLANRPANEPSEVDDPRAAGDPAALDYDLRLGGRAIGRARETVRETEAGVRLEREEDVELVRDGRPVATTVRLALDADRALRGTRIELAIETGALTRRARARRLLDGRWQLEDGDGRPTGELAADVEPLELALLALARDDRRRSRRVVLATAGFAVVDLRVRAHGAARTRAVLRSRFGTGTLDLERARGGRRWRRIVADGVEALARAPGTAPAGVAPDDAVDIIASGAIALATPPRGVLELGPISRPLPALAAQRIDATAGIWRVQPAATPPLSPATRAALVEVLDEVDAALADGADAPGADAVEALALGRADCTGRAALYLERARQRGFAARVVTGLRLDGAALLRHRWVEIDLDGAPLWIDPTFDEVPAAPGALLGLAAHGASVAELAESAAFAYEGLPALSDRPSDRSTPRTP